MLIIPEKWRNEWSTEQITILVLGSLSIQIGLIFLTPLRKHRAHKVLMLTLWLLYLTADQIANLALGNILSKQNDDLGIGIQGALATFWAPFLLLHLGGPDTITSYAVEDNELWWRHLLGLIVQATTAGFVFLQSLPNPRLWIPTLFIFVPGLLKYGERTLALRAASMDNLKDKIISERSPMIDAEVDFVSSDLSSESELILEGYNWFGVYKRLMVDVTFSTKTLLMSQDRFSEVSAKHALKLVAIELSFLYDILYTKAVVIHSISGHVVRCCSFISFVAALVVFHHLDKAKFKPTDIVVTYILLGSGLGLEVVAAVLLVISDWTVVSLKKSRRFEYLVNAIVGIVKLIFRNGKPRWSSTIGQYNLVAFCVRDKDTLIGRIMSVVKVKDMWDNMWDKMRWTKMIRLPDFLEEMMFNEAKRRAQNVHIYNVLVEARLYRGSQALERHGQLTRLEWSMKREFDECIILWHVATDICYYDDTSEPVVQACCKSEHDVSWKTSNYMIYLLTQQQSMMQLGYGKTRFEATCAVVKKIFKGQKHNDEAPRQLHDDEAPRHLHDDEPARQVPDQQQSMMQLACAWVKKIFKGQKHNDDAPHQLHDVETARQLHDDETARRLHDDETARRLHDVETARRLHDDETARRLHDDETARRLHDDEPARQVPDQQQSMMQLACAWVKNIFKGERKLNDEEACQVHDDEAAHQLHDDKAARQMVKEKAKDFVGGDERDKEGQSLLVAGLRLAKELQELDQQIKWKLISETWMEMLGYAAIHCDSYQHAKSLSRGGELLTHLWLLMAQLGVVEEHKMQQFQSASV